jgi:hypothetical protein
MLQSSILIDALSSAYWEVKNRRNSPGLFSQGRHALLAVPPWDYPGFYMQLTAILRVNPWILCVPNVLAVIILARCNQNYPSIASTSGSGFWSNGAQGFWFPTLSTILDLPYILAFNQFCFCLFIHEI